MHKSLHARTRPPILVVVLAAAIPREPQSVRGEAATPLPIWWLGGLPKAGGIVHEHVMLA